MAAAVTTAQYPPRSVLRCACGFEQRLPLVVAHYNSAFTKPAGRALCLADKPVVARILAVKEPYQPPASNVEVLAAAQAAREAVQAEERAARRDANRRAHRAALEAARRKGATKRSPGRPRKVRAEVSLTPSTEPAPAAEQQQTTAVAGGGVTYRHVMENIAQETIDHYNWTVLHEGYDGTLCDFFNHLSHAYRYMLGLNIVMEVGDARFVPAEVA